MKNLKKVLALVLAVVMIMGTVAVASAKDYSDVKTDNDYAVAIDALSGLEILNGFPDETFRPDGLLTRAEAAKIVAIIHNAATNGKIDADIADLYKNAQNSFVDCNNSWALPYINYCRITGLADGMTATTYEPNRKLTGVQFLKLMLTTLNFDSAKEGYTGKGWDINVLNRANEVGLTKGLSKDWRGINELKRGEAAQIIYNALTKYLVEYGQLVKNNYDTTDKYYKTSFISNEQVAKSGYTLAKKMGISVTRTTDKFRRPGYTWSYGSWSAFYMDTPLNSYTTAVSYCDILKNDIGYSETSGKSVDLNGHVGGEMKNTTADGWYANTYATELKVGGKSVTKTALNYVAIDGYKFAYNDNAITLEHDNAKNCQSDKFGGQGDLTQVFETEDGYVITVIHTFLANVTAVNNVDRKTPHTTGKSSDIEIWVALRENEPDYTEYPTVAKNVAGNTAYAKGDKVLTNLSAKKSEAENGTFKASIVSLADTKVGKLTGASDLHYPVTVSVDGTQYNGACRFVMGRESAMNFNNWKTSYTFYFDTYGNVIGCGPVTGEATNYTVMDRIYAEHVKGKYILKGDLYINGAMVEDATISTSTGSFGKLFDADALAAANLTVKNIIDDIDDLNDKYLSNALYTYTVDDKGVYTLTWVGETVPDTAWLMAYQNMLTIVEQEDLYGYGRIDTKQDDYNAPVQHIAKRASLSLFRNGHAMEAVNISESTKFICKGTDGTWKTYTGYTELPALTARYMDAVVEDETSSFASVVYLGDVTYAADKIVGFVPTWEAFNWADGYDIITVYVKGEAVKVNLKHGDQFDGEHFGDVLRDPGMYEFEMAVDKNGVAYAEIKIPTQTVMDGEGLVEECIDNTAIVVSYDGGSRPAIGLTGVKIYFVDGDKITEITGADLRVGDFVIVYSENDEITEIYVYNEDPRP